MGIPGGFGATLVGGLISAMLYGITTLQTYVYYMHDTADSSIIKFIVAAICVLDSLHVAFMCHILYYYLITNYGNPLSLEFVIWSFPASLIANLLVITIAQLFFAHKIYYLCRRQVRWLVTAPIILLVIAHLGFGMATVILMLINNKTSSLSQARFYSATPAVSTVVLAEVLITAALCILLYESGSRSAIPRTKRMLDTLIIYAVNRCLLTLLVAIAEVSVDASNYSAWVMGLDFIIGKLYANSLLASLNTREHLRSQGQGSGTETDVRVDAVHFANLQQLSEDTRSSKDEERHFEARNAAVINIGTVPVRDKPTTL
ncbi:hypothetical protein BKA82DRAFT_283364 [Pisolithus tinctorius]|uniref:DUF6534 domain-containing protein n=1 Tax=Pisolithus tinctorius Marx 270 TaxID=870435 RepID=A0A0C3PLS8_PISTI|nr:hypothetical protein BKA82DRAFT_283364 [Pisolithus tinctorius]KIO09706.1 hypothetical protein M404DRAFT_283364 [Pisolithus tinctorius Marx 270]